MERPAPRTEHLPIEIEPMRRRHLRGVVRIEQAVNPRPWSLNLFASELRYRESRVYLVARSGTDLVGFAGLMLVAGDGHITNVGVDRSHRRKAIATRLVLELARRALAEGAEALTLEVRVSNEAAQGLYRRFGFVPAGVRKAYYPPADPRSRADAGGTPLPEGAHEDALIMWANDIDTPEYRARLFEIEAALPSAETGDHD
ncbi:ribosomal protein S18-alanine N-acetyltransferase [Actinospongicola halichondriae]|uniref:ribosomal protein S18-alanine N-acetyltransferase n=1 Tax=Actinospongicola halichondriae TaxID=3236844 RepID=UPI003D58D2B9